MAAKKRKASPSRPAAPLTRRAPPTVYAPADAHGGGDELYVRLPLAPEVVIALKEHAANGARLLELVTGTEAAAADIFAAIAKTTAALERDVAKIRARLKRRR